jgi:preprotein translocase subunit SecD
MASWVQGRALRVQAIAAAIACALALAVAAPSVFSAQTVFAAWPGFLPTRQIRLGIEYAGGTSLLLEPDMNFVHRLVLAVFRHNVRDALRAQRIRYENLRHDSIGVTLSFVTPADVPAGAAILRHVARDWDRMPVGAAPGYAVRVTPQGHASVRITERLSGVLRERILRSLLDALRCSGDWFSAAREGNFIRIELSLNYREMAHVHFRPSC